MTASTSKGLKAEYRNLHTYKMEHTVGTGKKQSVIRDTRIRRPRSPSLRQWARDAATDPGHDLQDVARRWLRHKGTDAR